MILTASSTAPPRLRYFLLAFCLFSLTANAQTETPAQEAVDESKVIASDFDTPSEDSPADTQTKLPLRQRLSEQHKQLLEQARVKPTPVWITANTQQVLGFWQEDLSGEPAGAVLILHDEGESPITPEPLLNLQQYLPQESWATLSIELPNQARQSIPKRPTTPPASPPTDSDSTEEEPKETQDADAGDETQVVHDDSAAEKTEALAQPEETNSAPEMSSEDIDSQAVANIQAAIAYLKQQGQYNIVLLGDGYGALRALQYLQQGQNTASQKLTKTERNTTSTAIIDRDVRAVVLLNVQNSHTTTNQSLLDLFELGTIPLLDIYTHTDRAYQDEAEERRIEARKRKLSTYRQKKLNSAATAGPIGTETQLTKTIRGFLNRYAKGKPL